MTSGQRKAHKVVWLSIAILVTGLLAMILPELHFSGHKDAVKEEPISVELQKGDVRMQVNVSFPNPSAVVYELLMDDGVGMPLGQIQGRGSYVFKATPKTKGVVILDKVKEEELYKTKF